MTDRGPYTNRAARRRRVYVGPGGSVSTWSTGSFLAIILAILVVALAIAYGVNS